MCKQANVLSNSIQMSSLPSLLNLNYFDLQASEVGIEQYHLHGGKLNQTAYRKAARAGRVYMLELLERTFNNPDVIKAMRRDVFGYGKKFSALMEGVQSSQQAVVEYFLCPGIQADDPDLLREPDRFPHTPVWRAKLLKDRYHVEGSNGPIIAIYEKLSKAMNIDCQTDFVQPPSGEFMSHLVAHTHSRLAFSMLFFKQESCTPWPSAFMLCSSVTANRCICFASCNSHNPPDNTERHVSRFIDACWILGCWLKANLRVLTPLYASRMFTHDDSAFQK